MELFLLLSMGLSIVAFISIALTKAPPPVPSAEHNLDSTFPMEAAIANPEQLNLLKLEEENMLHNFDVEGEQREETFVTLGLPPVREALLPSES